MPLIVSWILSKVKEINGGRLLVNVWAGQKISASERRSGCKTEHRDKVIEELEGVKGHPTAFWDLIVEKYFGGKNPMEKVTKWANTVAIQKDNPPSGVVRALNNIKYHRIQSNK